MLIENALPGGTRTSQHTCDVCTATCDWELGPSTQSIQIETSKLQFHLELVMDIFSALASHTTSTSINVTVRFGYNLASVYNRTGSYIILYTVLAN